jgi:integrase
LTVVIQDKSYLAPFLFALKAPETKRQYSRNLKLFFDFGIDANLPLGDQAIIFAQKALIDSNWATSYLMQFFQYQIEKRVIGAHEIGAGTVRNYFKASKLFCIMNDINLNWLKITKGLPKVKYYSDDRAPTLEEIRILVTYPDRRIKPIIYTMLSSGIRIGAWEYLKWKHIIPITNDEGEVIAAKLIVYAGDVEEYFTFVSLEAYSSLKEWIDYRKKYGEKITGESWLMRDIWQTSERSYGATFGVADNPEKLNPTGIKSLIERAIHSQGLWQPLTDGRKRREWKGAHGLRKYFKTQCEQVMKTINVEFLMGHKSDKLQKAYYKPQEKNILDDYLGAADLLTVNDEFRLREKLKKLTERGRDNECIITRRLEELTKKQEKTDEFIQSLIESGVVKTFQIK